MQTTHNLYRHNILRLLDKLPDVQLREVYHFTVFLKERFANEISQFGVPAVRPDHLNSLVGLIAAGGDAVQDTEALYNEWMTRIS